MNSSFNNSNSNNSNDYFSTPAVNAPGTSRDELFPSNATYQLFHPTSGKFWWLKDGPNTIGRGLDNDIIIRDESVSRHHAKIVIDGSTIFIEDRGSSNGTYVAGEKVKNAVLMRDILFNLGCAPFIVRRPTMLDADEMPEWDPNRS